MAPEGPRASTTLVALCLTTALGVAVAGFLALISHHHQLGLRQAQNDRARELVQIGLEEALWTLNQDNWSSSGPANNTPWTTSGASRSVTLDYDSLHGVAGRVVLTIANYASATPAITVQAIATTADGRAVTKTQQAATGPAPLFSNAIASAEAGVSFAAGGTVDSWNSDPDQNPLTAAVDYSFTAGAPANYAAIVAGRDDGTNGVVLTQAQIRGYVTTFGEPVTYSTSGVPPGRVQGPATPGSVAVDMTRVSRSAFVPVAPVFAVAPPPTGGPNFNLINILLGAVQQILLAPLGIDLFQIPGDLDIQGTLFKPNLTVSRPMKIVVAGDLILGGSGRITIAPGGSLELIVSGDCTIGGNGIDNQNVEPAKCAIFCTGSSTSNALEYNTTEDFRGVIYCENKPIDIRQNATFHGALLSRRQVRFTAGATAPVFHYDTALRTTRFATIKTPYIVTRLTSP